MKTPDQKLYRVGGQLKEDITVYLAREQETPSIAECRHAVLAITTRMQEGYVA